MTEPGLGERRGLMDAKTLLDLQHTFHIRTYDNPHNSPPPIAFVGLGLVALSLQPASAGIDIFHPTWCIF